MSFMVLGTLRGGPFCLVSMWDGLLQCQMVPGLQAGGSNSLLPSVPSRLMLPLLEAFNSVGIDGNELLITQSNENQ